MKPHQVIDSVVFPKITFQDRDECRWSGCGDTVQLATVQEADGSETGWWVVITADWLGNWPKVVCSGGRDVCEEAFSRISNSHNHEW